MLIVTKYGSLNLLEPSGPVQGCNGTALPLPLPFIVTSIFTHLQFSFRVFMKYGDVDKFLARPTSRFILFDGENIPFDASFVIYIYIYIYI